MTIGQLDIVGERREIAVETGTYDDCVECLYAVDYGITALVAEEGEAMGFCRPLSVGLIVYVAGVGPVYSRERHAIPGDFVLGGDSWQRTNEASLIGFGGE